MLKFLIFMIYCHANGGNLECARKGPPRWALWKKNFLPELYSSIIVTTIILAKYLQFNTNSETLILIKLPKSSFISDPGGAIMTIIPSLLGFGIGVFALLFSVSSLFIKKVSEEIETKSDVSIFCINVDMAYPLVIMGWSIIIGTIQKSIPENAYIFTLSWLAFSYSIVLTIDLVKLLFNLSTNTTLEKLYD